MSKSDPGGCIFLDDEPAEIQSKLKSANTVSVPGKDCPEKKLNGTFGAFGKVDDASKFKNSKVMVF